MALDSKGPIQACPCKGRGERLFDVRFDPVAQPGMLGLPPGEPGGDVAAHLDEFAPVVNPAQLLQAVIGQLARQTVERVPQEVHVAALPSRAGEDLPDRLPQTLVIVRDDELDAKQSALVEHQEKIAPARPALAVGDIDPDDLASALAVDRHRDQHRLADDDPGLAYPLVARIQDQIGEGLAKPPLGKGPQSLVE